MVEGVCREEEFEVGKGKDCKIGKERRGEERRGKERRERGSGGG